MIRSTLDRQGGAAVICAIAAPVALTLILGASDYASVLADKHRLRSIAEAAAIEGARALALATDGRGAPERAKAWAETELQHVPNISGIDIMATLEKVATDERGVRVTIKAQRASLFGRLIMGEGWTVAADAVASAVGRTPLCVLAIEENQDKTINVKDTGLIKAPSCLVHSNRDIVVENKAAIEAGRATAVRRASGDIEPEANTGAQTIPDPFAAMSFSAPACLPHGALEFSSGVHTIPAGAHCADIKISGAASVSLSPGEHWFVKGQLEVKEDARVTGSNIVMLFDRDSKFKFDDRALMRFDGRETGIYAGFVMIADRRNTQDFIITSENVDQLLGVVYAPSARASSSLTESRGIHIRFEL